MRTCFVRLAAVLSAALCMHCTDAADVEVAEAEAKSGDPIHENEPWLWADTSFGDFLATARQPSQRGSDYAFDGGERIAARLQAWTDRIHAEVEADVRRATGEPLAAPKPKIVVLQAKEPNAWVTGVNACLLDDADLSKIGAPARPSAPAEVAVLERDEIKVLSFDFHSGPPRCATATNFGDVDRGIAFVNAAGGACKLRRGAAGVEVYGDGCQLNGSATTARKLAYMATSPYVTFTTAMIAGLEDERALVGILAHELAHYYRAHPVTGGLMARYGFWYEQTDPPPRATPPRATDSDALEARFRKVMSVPMPRVPGQALSYRLTLPILDVVATALNAASAPGFACEAAVGMLRKDWRFEFGFIGATHVSADAQAAYLAFESELLACAPGVPVTESGGAGALALGELREGLGRYSHRFARVEPHLRAGTLADVLAALEGHVTTLDAEAEVFLETLRSRKLGHYTVEQEADEKSLEYFTRLGLEARVRSDLELEVVRKIAAEDPAAFAASDGVDFATCERWYRADFREAGHTIFPPLGNLHDPHHGYCHRLFTLVQEQRAHGFRATGSAPTFAEPWEVVRATAEHATANVSPRPERMPSSGAQEGIIVDQR